MLSLQNFNYPHPFIRDGMRTGTDLNNLWENIRPRRLGLCARTTFFFLGVMIQN